MNLNLTDFFAEYQQLSPAPRYWVALSGGLDSSVLLYTLALWQRDNPQIALSAIHIDHGLQDASACWVTHCAEQCKNLGVDFKTVAVDAQPNAGESPEAAARLARYTAFSQHLQPQESLLTAHHQDDQAETFLLQLLRGAGTKGLSCMPHQTVLGSGTLVRPFLHFTREQLRNFALKEKLTWVEDSSNTDETIRRNYVRRQIIPALRELWPQSSKSLARSARHCAETEALLEKFSQQHLSALRGEQPGTLSCQKLLILSDMEQKYFLRRWLLQQVNAAPSESQLKHIMSDVIMAPQDGKPLVCWGDKQVRRFQGELYVMKAMPGVLEGWSQRWLLREPLTLPGDLGVLSFISQDQSLLTAELVVKFREGGERCQSLPQGKHQSLKQLMQEKKLPPWLRDRVPLVFDGEVLLAAVGLWQSERLNGQFSIQQNRLLKPSD